MARLAAAGRSGGAPRPGVLAGVFADPDVAPVHVRAVEYGCFTFEIRRVTG
jgi:hypothetical protein